MWRSPKAPRGQPPEDAGAASDQVETRPEAKPRRNWQVRWLDVVNLLVSVAILAVVAQAIPLLRDSPARVAQSDLASRLDELEAQVRALQAQLEQQANGAALEVTPLGTTRAAGAHPAVGFQVSNAGPGTAANVRAIITLDALAAPWNAAIPDIGSFAVRTAGASLPVSSRTRLAPATNPAAFGDNVLELTVESLAPGETLEVMLGLPDSAAVDWCNAERSGRVRVAPSRFIQPAATDASLGAMQGAFVGFVQSQADALAWLARFTADASCDNCGAPGSIALTLPAVEQLLVEADAPWLRANSNAYAAEWHVTVRLAFARPAGSEIPGYCDAALPVFPDVSAYSASTGHAYLYRFYPAD